MARKTYIVNGMEFKRKADLQAYVSGIYRSYKIGEWFSEEHQATIVDFLQQFHWEADTKIGVGIDHIRLTRNPKFKDPQLVLVRLDGTSEDCSLLLNKIQAPHPARDLTEAMRNAVGYNKIKEEYCRNCGELGPVEWDHQPLTFNQLRDMWFKQRGITFDKKFAYVDGKEIKFTTGVGEFFAAESKAEELDWVMFHSNYGNVEPLCKDCHREKTRKENKERSAI